MQDLKKQNPNYLIHEYLNQDWQCFSFQQVVRILEEIKLTYAGSTDLNSHLDNINFSEQHQQFLNTIEHPVFKEQCRDYFANTQFRKDLYIRGKNTLPALEIQHRLRNTAFVLLTAPEKLPKTISGYLGEFDLIQEIYQPLGAYFKQSDYKPQTIAELEQAIPNITYSKLLNALVILCHLGLAQPCQAASNPDMVEHAQKLNRYFLEQASYHTNYQVLACPLTGIGIPADQFTQLFYRAHFIDGLESAAQFAQYVWDVLTQLGWLVLDQQGNTVSDPKTSLEVIQEKAQFFLDSDKLKIAKHLKLFA